MRLGSSFTSFTSRMVEGIIPLMQQPLANRQKKRGKSHFAQFCKIINLRTYDFGNTSLTTREMDGSDYLLEQNKSASVIWNNVTWSYHSSKWRTFNFILEISLTKYMR